MTTARSGLISRDHARSSPIIGSQYHQSDHGFAFCILLDSKKISHIVTPHPPSRLSCRMYDNFTLNVSFLVGFLVIISLFGCFTLRGIRWSGSFLLVYAISTQVCSSTLFQLYGSLTRSSRTSRL